MSEAKKQCSAKCGCECHDAEDGEHYVCSNCDASTVTTNDPIPAVRAAEKAVDTVLGFNNLDDLGKLSPKHANRKHVVLEVAGIIAAEFPASALSNEERKQVVEIRQRQEDGYEKAAQGNVATAAIRTLNDVRHLLALLDRLTGK